MRPTDLSPRQQARRDGVARVALSGARGFTLVEIILVMVITGVLAGMVAMFIKWPVQNFAESKIRAELSDRADLAMRRMTRDLRLALPNSVRVSGDGKAIEFLQVKTGGRYLAVEDENLGAPVLSFTTPAALDFTLVGAAPSGRQAIVAGDRVVVYNLGPGFAPADAYAGGNIATVSAVTGNQISMASNPFAVQVPAMESPTRRFQVITGAVTYYCAGVNYGKGSLTRYWGYPLSASQVSPPTGTGLQSALLTDNVTSCSFSYDSLANTQTGMITISITLQRASIADEGPITLTQQVHVDNVP